MADVHPDGPPSGRGEPAPDERAVPDVDRSMISFLAHEVRSPLNVILGMAELLADSGLTAEQESFVRAIRGSGRALLAVIDGAVDLVRMASGGFEPELLAFSPRTCVEDTADGLAPRASARGLELVVLVDDGVPERVEADPARLRQVLTAMIDEAIRLGRNGEIVVRVGAAPAGEEPARLTITVECRCGVTGDWERPSRTGMRGPGLELAGRVAAAMGGSLDVESSGPGGYRSVLHLPVKVVPEPGADERPAEASLAGRRVLVVDDSEAGRRLLRESLDRWGCIVIEAGSGAEAVDRLQEAAERGGIDLAILDFVMPDMDGLELAAAIRAHVEYRSLPLILLTSMPRPGDGRRMRRAGFDAYLTKPVRRDDLRDALQSVLAGRGRGGGRPPELVTRHTLSERRRWRLRILLVDDDPLNRSTIAALLRRLGYHCDLAEDGDVAVRLLARREYDVVLMDCQMPVMDGCEATRRIREREREHGRRTPIVATTADTLAGVEERFQEAGVDGYLPKPVDVQELARVLSRVCGGGPVGGGDDARRRDGGDLVDPARLRAVTGGDAGFERELIALYLEESEARRLAIEASLRRGDLEAVHREAHALKGAAGNIGARRVAEVAAGLQRAAEAGDRETCDELGLRLAESARDTVRWLRRRLEEAAGDGGDEPATGNGAGDA